MLFPPETPAMSCNVKGCARPSFVGGRCGYHAMENWGAKRPDASRPEPAADGAPAPRRRPATRRGATRPASG